MPTDAPQSTSAGPAPSAEPSPPPALPDDAGAGLFSWEASEYVEHSKPASWYLILIISTLALAALAVFVLREILSALVIILMAAALVVYGQRRPRVLGYVLQEDGVSVGEKFYPYSDFRAYAVFQDGGVPMIELDPTRRFMPRVSMYFAPEDADTIFGVLDTHLPREDREPDTIDRLSRYLRF